jgi:ferredoxin-NADP reductase
MSLQQPANAAPSCVESVKKSLSALFKRDDETPVSLSAILKNCAENKLASNVCDEQVMSWLKELVERQQLPAGTEKELAELLKDNPSLAEYLSDKNFVEYAKGVAQGKSLNELRPTLFNIWKKFSTSGEVDPKLVEALSPKMLDVMKQAEAPFAGRKPGLGFSIERFMLQLKSAPQTMSKVKALINKEMDPQVLDSRVFDFYGYLNLQLDASRIRPWAPVQGGYKAISLKDVKGVDPTTWSKVSMLASEIEIPIGPYSDNSGETLRVLSPQASRFMGKTSEEAAAHRGHQIYCTNSWCTEENRHANVLESGAKGVVGYKLKGTAPFDAYEGLDPLKPQDAIFHLISRNDTEWHAGSAYFYLGSHADDALGSWIQHIREDELKHMSLFGGLYKYLFGDTYQNRLSGMLKKALLEMGEKGDSQFGDVFQTEPISALELVYTHVLYEKKIRDFFKSLPLKSLRKIYETDVNLAPLKAIEMDASKAEKIAKATEKEEAKRKALARWPKAQREAAEKLEYFEINYQDLIDKMITGKYGTFKGAETYRNPKHLELLADIEKLTPEAIKAEYGIILSADQIGLLKKSLSDTIRDYQVMNNASVRALGLNVKYVDAHMGFDIARDEAFQRAKKVENYIAPKAPVLGQIPQNIEAKVVGTERVNDTSFMVRVEKPAGMEIKPGEAMRVILKTANGEQFRTLSLASSPNRNYMEFAVRDSDSEFKKAFTSLKAGENITLQVAKGAMNFKPEEPAVMIAGGIGITPFRSMIQYAKDQGHDTPIYLYYGNRNQIPFKGELDFAASDNPNLKVTHVMSKPDSGWTGERGRVDESFLTKTLPKLPKNSNFYIVGPPEMVNDTKATLTKLGVPADRVQFEVFGYNPPAAKGTTADVERKVAQETGEIPNNQTVCFCHNISAGALRDAVKSGASTLSDIQTLTMATTGCGGCECNVMGILQCEAKKLGK